MRKNTEAQVSGGVAGGSDEGPVMGLERSSDVVPTESVGQPGDGEEPARAVKPFGIAKRVVWEAYRHVKANRGAAGIDGESMEMFEANLKDNLYRVWNRMSSGSYMPPAIRLVREQTQNKACYRVQDREHDVQGESDALPQKPQRAADKIAYVRVPAVTEGAASVGIHT